MRKPNIITLVFAVLVAVAAWWLFGGHTPREGFDPKQNIFSPETKKILDTGERFVLLSLSPSKEVVVLGAVTNPPTTQTFHKYPVLGKTEIRDGNERAELLRALYKGIADSDGGVNKCFFPRHGISATLGDETVELLICFECLSIQMHPKHGKDVLTTRSPERTFNRALEKANLPISKE